MDRLTSLARSKSNRLAAIISQLTATRIPWLANLRGAAMKLDNRSGRRLRLLRG